MSIDPALATARALAAELMTDQCRITGPPQGEPVLDEDTGQYVEQEGPLVYEGPCRVQAGTTQPANPEAAGWVATVSDYVVTVPVTATGLAIDQAVQLTAAAYDPALTGRRLRVASVQTKSHASARRLRCEVVET